MKKYMRFVPAFFTLLLCILIWLNTMHSLNRVVLQKTPLRIARNELKPDDFHQLIDMQNFSYIMAQPECAANVAALFVVHSAPRHFERRSRIRQTWGQKVWFNSSSPFHLIFLLGSVKDHTVQKKLQQENALFRDMVQGNFIDDYRNMTYKHMMAFKWQIYHCPRAQILIKLDDDTLVNTPQLIQYLKPKPIYFRKEMFNPARQLFHHPQNLIFCQRWLWVHASRSYRSKWRLDKSDYPRRYLPPYCAGFAIIYSTDVVSNLYKEQQAEEYFWIDDMRITGMIASRLDYKLTNMLPYVLIKEDVASILDGKKNFNDKEFIFAHYNIPKKKFMKLWQLIWLHYDLHTNIDTHVQV